MSNPEASEEIARLPLAEERPRVRRLRRVTGRVRVTVTTALEQRAVEEVLRHRRAEIERVPIGREVEAPPPIRQEGTTVIIPVIEERLVRRLVLAEELRLHLREEEEAVSIPVGLRRQQAAVERIAAPPAPLEPQHIQPEEDSSMDRTLIALFDSRAEADRAADALRGLNVKTSDVRVRDASGQQDCLPEDDRATWEEGLRRGGALVVAQVEERGLDLASDAMEAAGAVDVERREAEWRSQGWTGAASAAPRAAAPGARPAATSASGAAGRQGSVMGETAGAARQQPIPMAEERLRVGKRVAHGGRVRVRTYVVETPVEEQVRLREEHVKVERRPADRPADAKDADLFRERVVEAEESVEEPVVSKDVRVTGEVVVNKEATEHTETVRDKVRRTEVDVEKDPANDPARRGGKGAA